MSNKLETINTDKLVTATGGSYGGALHHLGALGAFGGLGGFGGGAAAAAANAQNQQMTDMCMCMALARR